jgi:hypothetical protein
MNDQEALFDLARRERFARDQGDWDVLLDCYCSGATVRTTWFDGSAKHFVEGSRAMFAGGLRAKHPTIPVRAQVVGDRALVESMGQILLRAPIHDVEYDVTAWCRFCLRAVREGGVWLIAEWEAIYVKDRIDPVNITIPPTIDWELAMQQRASYRFLTYVARFGPTEYTVNAELPGDDRPDLVQAFYADAQRWLAATG